jgi:TonB family protein
VMNGSIAGRRLFKDRREREALAADPSKAVREIESNLSRRIGLLEGELAEQTRKMQTISGNPDAAEERFQKLLSAMETFWAQAPRQFPQLSAPEAPVPEPPAPAVMPAPTRAAARREPRGWSVLGVTIASLFAILAGLTFPDLQRQWVRFASVEILPTVKPHSPAVPVLPAIPASQHSVVQPVIKTVATQSAEPFVGPLIPLDVPSDLKPKIQSEVRVDVVVAIDEDGKVTAARVASTKGESASLLVTEALRAARQSKFRPAREGEKTVQSHMVLTFLFKPESDEF